MSKRKRKPIKLKIVYHPLSELIPYARNSRTHSETQIREIMGSMDEWDWTVPIIIDGEKGVVAGHARLLAAERLGIDEIPCITRDDWSEAQKRGYVIADNKLAQNAGWDPLMLEIEFHDLLDMGFDPTKTGFSQGEIDYALEGWDSDHDKTEGTHPVSTAIPGMIKILFPEPDREKVTAAILDAIADLGLPDVEIH
jgi:ParB-like chromosome segregation protein Spo0J